MESRLGQLVIEAERAGLVMPGRGGELARFLERRGYMLGADEPEAGAARLEDSEQPRFVRGFHDILITIGILVLVAGAAGALSSLAIPPIAILLSEIFVKRQRLALPSVVLSVITLASVALLITLLPLDEWIWPTLGFGALLTAAAALYHWRYQTPISLAGVFYGIALLIFIVCHWLLLGRETVDLALLVDRRLASLVTLLGLALFAVALFFDLSDPQRRTRRSDTAFWLHLGAAPVLLNGVTGLVAGPLGVLWSDDDPQTAALVIAAVLLVMAIGLVIDRRAFVTAGLISLGAALAVLMNESAITTPYSSFWVVAIAIGLIVLSIGLFWARLRGFLLDLLPETLRRRLPPAR